MNRFIFLILTILTISTGLLPAQQNRKKVFTFAIDQDIDPAMNRRVKMAMEQAEALQVDVILIEMDTYGGAVTDADEIRTRILESKIPVYVFINKDAASAGALISIACDSIYMAPGASIGAATVVNGTDGTATPDKYQSYMRSMMRSTAEATGRNPQIAEAMVDEKLVVAGISDDTSVITFSVAEAIKNGFCEGEFTSIKAILASQNLQAAEVISYEEKMVDSIISFFLSPAVSGILILLIIGGIYFELQTPGVGFPLAVALIAALLYFIPYYLNGLAENWEILAFVIGIILLAVEFFIIPGFGVFGVAGIVLTLGGLVLGMLPNQSFDFELVPSSQLFGALLTVILSSIAGVGLVFWLTPKVNDWGAFRHLTLASTQERSQGYTASTYAESLLGKIGTVHSRLRPSGKVEVDGEIYDAYSRGEFLEQGESIEVISTEGTSIRVKKRKA
ncbi:MAG: nodulation protein NfeD [Bacteroidetes bacterium]|nr:nodulation protein NfeD [Bacteroidota bacterium]